MVAETGGTGQAHALFSQALNWELPDLATTLALVRLVWAASSDNLSALNASPETLHSLSDPCNQKTPMDLDNDDILLCKEALELLSTAVVLNPSSLEHLYQDNWWPYFITDLVLLNPSCAVRIAAAEQLIIICTCGAASRLALQLITPLLFSLLNSLVLENANTSHEFFQLLCRLVNVAYLTGCPLSNVESLLANEVAWLRKARGKNEVLIEGHLSLAKELLSFMSTEQKCELGSAESGSLIKELLEDFLFPASKLMLQLSKTGQLGEDPAIPICDTPQTQAAAFDLLISLCLNCVQNYRQLVSMLNEMFYSGKKNFFSTILLHISKYTLILFDSRSRLCNNGMGLPPRCWSATLSGFRRPEECWRDLLHELHSAAVVHGGQYKGGHSGCRRGSHRSQ